VLGIAATAKTFEEARTRAYRAVDAIDWPGGFCRRDIGWRAINRD
jgi:phosphoribosylamine--glycine ligase